MAMLPMAVTANGIIPLTNNNCVIDNGFPVNSGLISIEESGTYLATYTVRVPEGAALDSTITLNVNDASQSSAIAQVGGTRPPPPPPRPSSTSTTAPPSPCGPPRPSTSPNPRPSRCSRCRWSSWTESKPCTTADASARSFDE